MTTTISRWLHDNRDLGVLFLRLFIGLRLIYGVMDNVLTWEHMKAFESFLDANGFPFPLIAAIVSVYAQLICGLLILIGYQIRIASAIMIVNFLVAILMVHSNDTIEGMTPALAMLFGSILFLFYGPGRFSVGKLTN
jgi:putative oxidoreductase